MITHPAAAAPRILRDGHGRPLVATFSIVGHDPRTGDLGIAVQSKFLAVGAVVPWARAGVGAVATQAWGNTTYGPRGLDLLAAGQDPEQVAAALVAGDPGAAQRQFGLVDAQGRAATYTGDECMSWAGGRTGPHFAAQGNILVSADTVDAMVDTFLTQQGRADGELSDHLLAALAAGQAAGGDSRGMQAAALLVVRAHGGYSGFNDRYVDLRVDDHPYPIAELRRLLDLHQLYFRPTEPAAFLPLEAETLDTVQTLLQGAGYLPTPGPETPALAATVDALTTFAERENLEDRLAAEPRIDPVLLTYLRHYVEGRPAPAGDGEEPGHLHLVRPSERASGADTEPPE